MSFERICEAIKFDGLSVNGVAAAAKIPQSSLQRFCSGQQGLQMDGLRSVCDVLNMELVRRFNAEELAEYFQDGWSEAKDEIQKDTYESEKSEAWDEHTNEEWKLVASAQWQEYADEHEIAAEDTEEFEAWETDAWNEWKIEGYESWSISYDEEHYGAWESEACATWEAEERERLESCEWIVLTA